MPDGLIYYWYGYKIKNLITTSGTSTLQENTNSIKYIRNNNGQAGSARFEPSNFDVSSILSKTVHFKYSCNGLETNLFISGVCLDTGSEYYLCTIEQVGENVEKIGTFQYRSGRTEPPHVQVAGPGGITPNYIEVHHLWFE